MPRARRAAFRERSLVTNRDLQLGARGQGAPRGDRLARKVRALTSEMAARHAGMERRMNQAERRMAARVAARDAKLDTLLAALNNNNNNK